jgi:hypothetical protein
VRSEFEAFLARIYTDPETRARFIVDPSGQAQRAGLRPDECRTLEQIDRAGLELVARSFARKRAQQRARGRPWSRWFRRLILRRLLWWRDGRPLSLS